MIDVIIHWGDFTKSFLSFNSVEELYTYANRRKKEDGKIMRFWNYTKKNEKVGVTIYWKNGHTDTEFFTSKKEMLAWIEKTEEERKKLIEIEDWEIIGGLDCVDNRELWK